MSLLFRHPCCLESDNVIRREIEGRATHSGKRDQLVIVLETTGGSIEIVERISDVFRHHYKSVIFVIPNFVYSAGTIRSLSDDEIYMNYYPVLGPIDPQITKAVGGSVPGFGSLKKYDALIEKSRNAKIREAVLAFFINKFDPVELFLLEQAKKHSTKHFAGLIIKWLCEYKFKNWNIRQSNGKDVDDDYKQKRAEKIATLLGDPTVWGFHGRGIS